MMEFHWIDMHPGYFNMYDNLSKIDFTKKSNNSIIHCLAGFGRTGSAILLVICVNYYRKNSRKFNNDFFVNSNKPNHIKSSSIVTKLKSLLIDFTENDTEIPDNLGISDISMQRMKDNISGFNIKHIIDEVFLENFHTNQGYFPSFTDINTFIVRINYIVYFTSLRNGIKKFPLFALKNPSYFRNKVIPDNTVLFEHILNDIKIYSHNEVEKIMNDNDIVGFDLQELPIVDGFDFDLLTDFQEISPSSRCSIS